MYSKGIYLGFSEVHFENSTPHNLCACVCVCMCLSVYLRVCVCTCMKEVSLIDCGCARRVWNHFFDHEEK